MAFWSQTMGEERKPKSDVRISNNNFQNLTFPPFSKTPRPSFHSQRLVEMAA